jgi:hypothetical protein
MLYAMVLPRNLSAACSLASTAPPGPAPPPSRHSQRTNERRYHLAGTWAFGAVALFLLPLALHSFRAAFAVIVLAAIGTFGAEGIMVRHA